MKTMTFEQLRAAIHEAHGDKNDRGWRKNQKPGNKKERLHEEDNEKELEVTDTTEEDDNGDDEEVKIVTFKTTDKFLADILQSDAGINGITISTADDVQTFGPESFGDIEVNDWNEDDVEDDEDDSQDTIKESNGNSFRLQRGISLFHFRDLINKIINQDRDLGNSEVVVVGKGERIPLSIETINYKANGEIQLIVDPGLSWGGVD